MCVCVYVSICTRTSNARPSRAALGDGEDVAFKKRCRPRAGFLIFFCFCCCCKRNGVFHNSLAAPCSCFLYIITFPSPHILPPPKYPMRTHRVKRPSNIIVSNRVRNKFLRNTNVRVGVYKETRPGTPKDDDQANVCYRNRSKKPIRFVITILLSVNSQKMHRRFGGLPNNIVFNNEVT